jgi:hypothetical protein
VAKLLTLMDALSVWAGQVMGGLPFGLMWPVLPSLVQSQFPV